jgi:hypothetical protein
MTVLGDSRMAVDEPEVTDAQEPQRIPGRPRLGKPRRVRVTTTIEPSKLALLREHARQSKKSLGQLADEYVEKRFAAQETPLE